MTDDHSTIGLQRGTVRLVSADASWPEAFTLEATRLQRQIAGAGLSALLFEHIGSTAVPGLPAKPIIDFMAGYQAGINPESYFTVLQRAGYAHRGPQGVADRELFVLGPETRRTHHLNLVASGGPFWRDHIVFRDRLREEPDLRAAYAALKLRLAARHSANRSAYTAGKADFVAAATLGKKPPPAS